MQVDLAFPRPLTEKYRPTRIADFIGLERPKKILSAFCKRPASGAWLFIGPSGLGKSTMAMALSDSSSALAWHAIFLPRLSAIFGISETNL
jgi:DNA polymerase III gamma/tau subunit